MKLIWYKGREVKSQEENAIREALNNMGYSDMTCENIQEWIDDDTITLNTCRDGNDVVWILTENKDMCIRICDLHMLDKKEKNEQLL